MKAIHQLLATVRGHGIELWAEGDQLHFRATVASLPAELHQELTARKAELVAFLRPVPAPVLAGPSSEFSVLVAWYAVHRHQLPRQPFELSPGVFVSDPERFYASLDRDIAAGPGSAAVRLGGLASALRRLRFAVERAHRWTAVAV